LIKQGLKIHTNTKFVSGVNNKEKGVKLTIEDTKGKSDIDCNVALLSIGRRAFTDGLQLEKAGLTTVQAGKIEINKTW